MVTLSLTWERLLKCGRNEARCTVMSTFGMRAKEIASGIYGLCQNNILRNAYDAVSCKAVDHTGNIGVAKGPFGRAPADTASGEEIVSIHKTVLRVSNRWPKRHAKGDPITRSHAELLLSYVRCTATRCAMAYTCSDSAEYSPRSPLGPACRTLGVGLRGPKRAMSFSSTSRLYEKMLFVGLKRTRTAASAASTSKSVSVGCFMTLRASPSGNALYGDARGDMWRCFCHRASTTER